MAITQKFIDGLSRRHNQACEGTSLLLNTAPGNTEQRLTFENSPVAFGFQKENNPLPTANHAEMFQAGMGRVWSVF